MKKKKILVVDFRINYFRCPAPKFKSQQNSVSLSPSLFFFLSLLPPALSLPRLLFLSLSPLVPCSQYLLYFQINSHFLIKKKNEQFHSTQFLIFKISNSNKNASFHCAQKSNKMPIPDSHQSTLGHMTMLGQLQWTER